MARVKISRREFLKLSALGLGGLAFRPGWGRIRPSVLPEFPEGENLGRAIATIPLKARPDADSATVRQLFEDEIFPVNRRVVGSQPFRVNQTWVETPEGYAWSPDIQPVRNHPNQPSLRLPETSHGKGFWVEVSVPYVNLEMLNKSARAPWLANRLESGMPPRFFYSQIAWVDQIKIDDSDQVWYRINEKYGYGDMFWAPAEALRPLTPEEMTPISTEVENKRILVDITRQTMSCFEGQTEVYYARVSTGALYNIQGQRVEEWGTPLGQHRIWRKTVSLPLSGGSAAAGWDLPAVGWISLFVGSGVAFHSTYWHNNYGVPTSRGCVNCSPDDAKWVFRWTLPSVPYDPGDVTVGMPGGTLVEVREA